MDNRVAMFSCLEGLHVDNLNVKRHYSLVFYASTPKSTDYVIRCYCNNATLTSNERDRAIGMFVTGTMVTHGVMLVFCSCVTVHNA